MSDETQTVRDALETLAALPEDQRSELARVLDPSPPTETGSDSKRLSPEQARELLLSDPAKFHAIADAQAVGGPEILPQTYKPSGNAVLDHFRATQTGIGEEVG